MKKFTVQSTNIILYCDKWIEAIDFYHDILRLDVNFKNNWFIEFSLNSGAFLSVVDAQRATIDSGQGAGITITFKVADIFQTWQFLQSQGVNVEKIRNHPWGAYTFYFFDPEGHRLEAWMPKLK